MQRPDPLYSGTRQPTLGLGDGRAGSAGRANGGPNETTETNQTRAAKFEDEKRRIIDSCFSKRDPDGSQIESYITHVRIVEDAMYPSSPPPPEADPKNKKSRVILVAVRKSGKVRVHKARENPTGTFSIGKTWNLEELSSIKSYNALNPSNNQEQLEKQWASNVGFIVTIVKPYYWQAPTSKEKDFFLASLIKIYRKYTGGKLPDLLGFELRDIEQLVGTSPNPNALSGTGRNASGGQSAITSPNIPSSPAFNAQQPLLSPRNPNREVRGNEPQEWDRSYDRAEYQPSNRSESRKASEESGRSPMRPNLRSVGRDDPKPQAIPDRPAYQNPTFSTETRQPEMTQEIPKKPSLSPKSSHSSFARSNDKRSGITDTRPNGLPFNTSIPGNSSKRDLSTKSQESIRSGSEATASSRPSTATTDRRTPEPTTNGFRNNESSIPNQSRPPLPVPDPAFAQRIGKAEPTNHEVTPTPTPVVARERPRGILSGANEISQEQLLKKFADNSSNKPSELPNTEKPHQSINQDDSHANGISDTSVGRTTTPKPKEDEPLQEGISSKTDDETGEDYRPGLGPMIKKKSGKDIANQIRKAALAASAFQPRQGGAGARLKALQEKTSNEPDGITGVVPAPLFRGASADSAASTPNDPKSPRAERSRPGTPASTAGGTLPRVHLQRIATDDSAKPSQEPPAVADTSVQEERSTSPEKTRSGSPQRKRRQKLEAEVEKHCSSLGIDPRILEGRGIDFNELLTEFGWEGKLADTQKVDSFTADVRREIGRAQATGWLGHVEQQESKVQELAKAFDKAISECEELDGLLTLYSHELDTLHDDIEYIEAQSQGLQVQTANQKLLHSELETLLKTLTIPTNDLRSLRTAPIDTSDGIQAIESSLLLLYKAMLTIDPELRQNQIRQATATISDRPGVSVYADTEIGQMQAVRQKKDDYREETSNFLKRFNQHMISVFQMVEQRNSEDNTSNTEHRSRHSGNAMNFDASRRDLWRYNIIMLFVREVNSFEWKLLIRSLAQNSSRSYQEPFEQIIMTEKGRLRAVTPDELEVYFTHQEKDKNEDSLTSTAARKLTVKRGKTVKASVLRQSFGEKRNGRKDGWEIFGSVLQTHVEMISDEQNFFALFFHANSQSTQDFAESVSTAMTQNRQFPNLKAKLSYEPDRTFADITRQAIDEIFSFWPNGLQALVEWVLSIDQLQAVGLLHTIERVLTMYEETNQEYIMRSLKGLLERVATHFTKFVDEQVKVIEETKVKIKKRKGVISFMRTFPLFSVVVENMMTHGSAPEEWSESRKIVNDAYTKILKAMWESLNFIAKDDPASGGAGIHSAAPSGGDPEDKEALNYHILLIENMNHYVEEVESRHNILLEEWKERASHDLFLHLDQYTDAVIRRPLGKWLDFLESSEALMKTSEDREAIVSKPSHSRNAVKKVLSNYDSKEIRKGIDTLKKRVEKHFADVDDPSNFSGNLISRVFDECNARYARSFDRMKLVLDDLYRKESLEIEWRREDLGAMFKR